MEEKKEKEMDLKNPNKKMKGMKEMKEMKVTENDIESFSELIFTIAVVQATNAVIELIKVIIEANFNKKEETEREIN